MRACVHACALTVAVTLTQDVEWDCPRCFWKLPAVDKDFWHRCFKAGGEGIRVQLLSNTELFPFKPAAYCHREHYSVMLHKKQPAAVFIFEQPKVHPLTHPPLTHPYTPLHTRTHPHTPLHTPQQPPTAPNSRSQPLTTPHPTSAALHPLPPLLPSLPFLAHPQATPSSHPYYVAPLSPLSQAKLAVLTVSSTPPTGEYGKQKMHYLTELSVENKRQYAC